MKKTTKVVLGVLVGIGVVVIVVVGAAVWLAVRQSTGREVATETEVRTVSLAELPDGEVDLDKVQGLYEQFEISGLQGFYGDELLIGGVWGDNRERGRLEMALNQVDDWTGVAVRAKYQEMFGEEIELSEEKYGAAATQGEWRVVTGMGFVAYNEEADEFRKGLEPSTVTTGRHIRRLERAEKEGDKIYLYERALTLKCQLSLGVDEEGNSVDKEASCGVLTVAATCGTPEFGWSEGDERMTDEEILSKAAGSEMGLVRWTFERMEDGRYVYRGMESVIGDGSGIETEGLDEERNESE